jgi:aspartate racemase
MSTRPLALALPREQPFYCLQAQGLDGRTKPFSTVEDAAEFYLDTIRAVQPHGPYNLAGGCYGGLVAYEMACRLRSMGETVSVLALIDTENHAYSTSIPKGRVLYYKARFMIRRTIHHLRQLESIDPSNRPRYLWLRARLGWSALIDFIRSLSEEIRPPNREEADNPKIDHGTNDDGFQQTLDVVREASIKAGLRFVPKPYRGDVLIFRAKQRPDDPYSDRTLGWDPVVFGGVSAYEIDADHNTIFTQPAIQSVAEILDAAITARELDRRYRI